jgi:TolA-binding protein
VILVVLFFCLLGCGPKEYLQRYGYFDNQEADLIFDTALRLEEQGKYAEAVVEYQHFLDYSKELYRGDEAMFGIGRCYEKLDQYNEAINIYERLIRSYQRTFLHPKRNSRLVPQAMFRKGVCHNHLGEWKMAVEVFKKVMKRYFDTQAAKDAREAAMKIIEDHKRSRWARRQIREIKKIVREKMRE